MNIRMAGCRACQEITSGDCGMHGPIFIPASVPTNPRDSHRWFGAVCAACGTTFDRPEANQACRPIVSAPPQEQPQEQP